MPERKKSTIWWGNSQVWSVVSVSVYNPLIYSSHVACVVFVWPLLIGLCAQQRASAPQTFTLKALAAHTQQQSQDIRERLFFLFFWWATMARVALS